MSDNRISVPAPTRKAVLSILVPAQQRTTVTGAETETTTQWKKDSFKRSAPCPDDQGLVAVAQETHLTSINTRTRTHWVAADEGVSLDEAVASGAFIRPGTTVILPGGAPDLSRGKLVAQKTKVTGADTETATHWDVAGDEATVTGQKTEVVGLETKTKSRWDFRGTHTTLGRLLGER